MTSPGAFCQPRAFVAMPVGERSGRDGAIIDFSKVYQELIEPALKQAGVEPFRPEREAPLSEICPDTFQELLLADLVLADLTIDSPSIWYALGVRHALRAGGVVLICGGHPSNVFERFKPSTLGYGLSGGGPDPARLGNDREALAGLVSSILASGGAPRTSPVFTLLPQLGEPPLQSLRVRGRGTFNGAYEAWQQHLALASKAGHIGDVLVLADEAPEAALRARAWIEAGVALAKLGEDRFAIEQLDRGLGIEPNNLTALRQSCRCLQRLARAGQEGFSGARAMADLANLLATYPKDAETWALAGQVYQDDWLASWHLPDLPQVRKRQLASASLSTLHQAETHFLAGFRADPTHVDAGLHALTLMHLARHLGDPASDAEHLLTVSGAVRFAAISATNSWHGPPSFKALANLAELAVLEGSCDEASAAYGQAVSQGQPDHAAVDTCRSRLSLLRELGFRPEVVQVALDSLDRAIAREAGPQAAWRPRLVILFSGHMIDQPQRAKPRFPPSLEKAASQRIEAALAELDAGADDLAISQAASGGDLLFLEACQRRGVRRQVLLPFEATEFIERSILPSLQGDLWRKRFNAMAAQVDPSLPIRTMPEALGPAPKGRNPYERCNDWLLYSGLSHGLEKLRFLCLWDGGGGDGRGGTAHMVREVEEHTGRVIRIDTHSLSTT